MELDAPTLGVLIAAPLIILFIYIMLRLRSGDLAKKLEPVLEKLGGELVKDFPRSFVRIQRNNIEYSIVIWGDRDTPQNPCILEIKVKQPFSFRSEIYKKTDILETIERIGFLKDIKVGESAFDDRFLLRANDAEKVRQYLLDNKRWETIINLCENEYTVMTGKKYLTLRKGSYKDEDLDPENIQFIMGEIKKLL